MVRHLCVSDSFPSPSRLFLKPFGLKAAGGRVALAALAGCYHAGALVVPTKPASVAAAAAATSPSPDLQIPRIFPASISKEISSPTSSVKLNSVLIASNAIGSALTNAAQAYWLANMMIARFAQDPVWYKDDIEDVNVDVVATHTRLRIQ